MDPLYATSIKHKTLSQCWFNVGPASQTGSTLKQHWLDVSCLLCSARLGWPDF